MTGSTHIEAIRQALKQATAEHLRHHQLLPDWAADSDAALAAVAAELAELREALERIASGEGHDSWKRGISPHGEAMLIARAALSRGATP